MLLAKYQKTADKEKNRVIIPINFIRKYGRNYFMEVYEDYIKIIPIKKGE